MMETTHVSREVRTVTRKDLVELLDKLFAGARVLLCRSRWNHGIMVGAIVGTIVSVCVVILIYFCEERKLG